MTSTVDGFIMRIGVLEKEIARRMKHETDLLAANNRYLFRARDAEARVTQLEAAISTWLQARKDCREDSALSASFKDRFSDLADAEHDLIKVISTGAA